MRIGRSKAVTDTGRRRMRNEDAFVFEPPLFAIADGMGGARAGEVAAGIAAAALREGRKTVTDEASLEATLVDNDNVVWTALYSFRRVSNGDWLIFVDADTLVSEAVVRSAVEALRSGAVGGGAAVEFDGTVPLYARLLLPVLVRSFRWAGLAAGCFLFCTRHAFAAVGGFDEAFYGAEELVMSRALKRHGRFVVLRQAVITSGRKLRTHSVREMLAILARLALRGPGAVKQRQGMDLWYAERREDPQQDALTGRLRP